MATTRKARSTARPDDEPGEDGLPPEAEAPGAETAAGDLRVLKKYPNRRLYDTRVSGYITLADVKQMVLDHERFVVRDAKTGEDLTRSILLQIILEEESGGLPMFSEQMLAQVIRYYGHTMQGLMGSYLEQTMQSFVELQNRFAEQLRSGGQPPGAEAWAPFMNLQNPLVQQLMGPYMDSSKTLFQQMQEQMQKQTETLFGGRFPGAPGGSGR
ncbi:polyhydroxyalkanoate synthesis repressor PhaR [Aquariibacter albus]|uniref:Polyhydroxyalkanoate synthesis repressor PhaR n=1 Tax=Aquariibacter albus TaxID=2759899 RepID=A0A839HIN4_9BURK|nr:polyhydroxyalkanoate synthesis repressor PhaR [Aquariibacter albus]MBB1162477.1 polyhydroxyalkanoate synthesis repressor PhaR [Aquariibacter albus]